MKHTDRLKKAEYLFSEMSGIDERLLHEAMVYKRRPSVMPKLILIAACLALVVSLGVGSVVVASRAISTLMPLFEAMQTQKPDVDDQNGLPGQPAAPKTLDEMLVLSRDTATYTTERVENLNFYDGKARIIWQYGDEESVCVSRALTPYELTSLRREVQKGTSVGESSPDLTCRVWISLGDGSVVSPYLKLTDGNVGVAELFDYDAELMPTESFNSQISDILN